MKKKLKLYVWENVLADWTDGIAFALAKSPEHARELLEQKAGYRLDELDSIEPKVVEVESAFYVYGGG